MVEAYSSIEPAPVDVWHPEQEYDFRRLIQLWKDGDKDVKFPTFWVDVNRDRVNMSLGCFMVYYHRLMRNVLHGVQPTAWEKEWDDVTSRRTPEGARRRSVLEKLRDSFPKRTRGRAILDFMLEDSLANQAGLTLDHTESAITQSSPTLDGIDPWFLEDAPSEQRYVLEMRRLILTDEMSLRTTYRHLGMESLLQRTDQLAFMLTPVDVVHTQVQSDIEQGGQKKLAHALDAALSPMLLEVPEHELQLAVLGQIHQLLLRPHRVLALDDSGVIDLLPRERGRFEKQLLDTLDAVERVEGEAEQALRDEYPEFFSSLLVRLGGYDTNKVCEQYSEILGDDKVEEVWRAMARVGHFYDLMTYSRPDFRRNEAEARNYGSLTHYLGYFLSAR